MKQVGFIGLGKMGGRMCERLIDKGFQVFGFDQEKVEIDGLAFLDSVDSLASSLSRPRTIILSVPAPSVDEVLDDLSRVLDKGDIIIDTGNCYFKESQKRASALEKKGIFFLDAGVSGGISGARQGACLMVGGDLEAFLASKEIISSLSDGDSYAYIGMSGSGHLVKGYHNLIEYGYLQALAEGVMAVEAVAKKEALDIRLDVVLGVWNKGSIIESRLVRDAKEALELNPGLVGISGSVSGQTLGEMQRLADIAEGSGAEVRLSKTAIDFRIKSSGQPSRVGKMINAVRKVFGGHQEWKK